MKNKLKLVLALGCASLACAGFAACGPQTQVEINQANGYKISVTYDANGGKFLNADNISIMDMFNPEKYEEGTDGKIHIKLLEPTSKSRPASGNKNITLALADYFFAGWYQTREIVTVDGSPVDDEGKKLVEQNDGSYVYADTVGSETPRKGRPAYTYSDYWDFENDTLDYAEEDYEDGICEITLYAGWVKEYEFNYYYKIDGQTEAAWTKLDKATTFDYKEVNAAEAGSVTADKDSIYIPVWPEDACTVKYAYKFQSGADYTFPKVSGTTFLKAYSDPACTQELTGEVEHFGTLIPDDGEKESLKVENRVQNIYILLEEGEQYRISTAKQLEDNPNVNGIYEICADLNFTGITWPVMFTSGNFKGKMFGSNGNTYKLSNISAKHDNTQKQNNEDVKAGGLFGTIEKGAEIKDLSFENVTFDLLKVLGTANEVSFGMFAGVIDDEATIVNVSVGGTLRLGEVTRGTDCQFNLWANGNVAGLTKNDVQLEIYGLSQPQGNYKYSIDTDSVKVDENGDMTFERAKKTFTEDTRYKDVEVVVIDYKNNNSEVE